MEWNGRANEAIEKRGYYASDHLGSTPKGTAEKSYELFVAPLLTAWSVEQGGRNGKTVGGEEEPQVAQKSVALGWQWHFEVMVGTWPGAGITGRLSLKSLPNFSQAKDKECVIPGLQAVKDVSNGG